MADPIDSRGVRMRIPGAGRENAARRGCESVRVSGRVKDRVNVKRLLYEHRLIEVARGQGQMGDMLMKRSE